MLPPDQQFAVNTPEVAAKVIDEEAIIMNLSTGMYYSIDRTGAAIWEWLERGYSIAQIVEGLTGRYEVSLSQAQADVEQLISQLLQDGLVQVATASGESPGRAPAQEGPRLPYNSPELNRYGDMAELLALDPPMPRLAATPWTRPEQ